MDPVTLGMAKADAKKNYAPSNQLRERMNATAAMPLFIFNQALAARNCDILMLGDSKSEGQGASIITKRWQDQFRDSIRAKFGLTGGIGYVPAWSSAAGTPTVASWAYGGTVTNNGQETGLGRRQATLNASGTATITVDCTSVKLFFGRKNTSADAVSITIDGGEPATYTIPGTGGGDTTSGGMWTSPNLGPGTHTIIVARTGGSVIFEGGFFYKGDETTGIRTWDGSHSGYLAHYFANADAHSPKWQGVLPLIKPHLTIVAFGTNEWRTAMRTPAQFQQDLTNLISAVRTKAAQNSSFVIVMYSSPIAGGTTALAPWSEYVAAAYAVGVNDTSGIGGGSGVAVLDMGSRQPQAEYPDPWGLHTDGIHFTDKGNLLVMDAVLGFVTPK